MRAGAGRYPCISEATSAGITINPGTEALPAVDNHYQRRLCARLPGRRAAFYKIDGVYFEECVDADISWSDAKFPRIVSSYQSSTGGRVCL